MTVSGVPPGRYVLSATWSIAGETHHFSSSFLIGKDDIALQKLSELRFVQVQASVILPPNTQVGSLTLYRRDNSQQKVVAALKSGAFVFPPVPSGEYLIGIPVDKDLYLKFLTLGGKRTEYSTLFVSDAQPTEKIVLEFDRTGAQLKGKISNWQPGSQEAQMVLVRDDTGQVFTQPSDKNGAFYFVGLSAASYHLYAWQYSDAAEYRNPAFLHAHERDGSSLTLSAGSVAEVNVLTLGHLDNTAR
jgi:hypothetical protein